MEQAHALVSIVIFVISFAVCIDMLTPRDKQ